MKVKRNILLYVLILLLFQAIPVFSQNSSLKPRIAVKKLSVSDTENIQLKVISERVTESTKMVLKFMNEYELTESNLDSVSESVNSMLEYCNKNNIDNIVYGKTYMGSDDSFVIEMSVFSREKEQTALSRIGRAETALDIFEATDNLTASIIEEFSGIHIAFGKIHLRNTGVEGAFIPYIDGEPFPPDSYTFENLLIGKRTVEIKQMRMFEETIIYTEELIVKENAITDASFEIPHILPAEGEVISDYDKIIDKNWDKLKRKDKTARAFNELDSLLSNTPYNLSLADLRAEYKKKRVEWEANLAKLGKKEKREFIVGASMGVTVGMVDTRDDGDGKSDSDYDPIDENKWNDEIHPSPSFGINVQYQLYNSFYIQTELNYKEVSFYEFDGKENYIEIMEIPVLLKFVKQFDIHRIGVYMGPTFYSVTGSDGALNDIDPSGLFNHIESMDGGAGMVMGMEYGIKKGRHLLTAGLRYSILSNILNYSFYDVGDDETYDQNLRGAVPELILGYGYNLGGSGRIETEENKDKWLFPTEAGLMFMLSGGDENTMSFAGLGFLRKITESLYAGIKAWGFEQGGVPMLSLAYTKDPDTIIHNYSLTVFPMMGMVIGSFEYNIGINRFSLGAFIGGPMDQGFENMAIGIGAGYYF